MLDRIGGARQRRDAPPPINPVLCGCSVTAVSRGALDAARHVEQPSRGPRVQLSHREHGERVDGARLRWRFREPVLVKQGP